MGLSHNTGLFFQNLESSIFGYLSRYLGIYILILLKDLIKSRQKETVCPKNDSTTIRILLQQLTGHNFSQSS